MMCSFWYFTILYFQYQQPIGSSVLRYFGFYRISEGFFFFNLKVIVGMSHTNESAKYKKISIEKPIYKYGLLTTITAYTAAQEGKTGFCCWRWIEITLKGSLNDK